MSISTSENQNKQSVLQKEAALPVVNVKQAIGKFFKAIPTRTIDFIVIFSYTTTAIGELFGRDYGWKWYGLLLLLLAAFVAKEIVEPAPKEDKKLTATDE